MGCLHKIANFSVLTNSPYVHREYIYSECMGKFYICAHISAINDSNQTTLFFL